MEAAQSARMLVSMSLYSVTTPEDCDLNLNYHENPKSHITNTVYFIRIHALQHLWEIITAAIATATPDMLSQIWTDSEYFLNLCQMTNSAYIDAYSNGKQVIT